MPCTRTRRRADRVLAASTAGGGGDPGDHARTRHRLRRLQAARARLLTGAIRISPRSNGRRAAHPRFQAENFSANRTLVARVEAIARETGCTPSQLALAWLLAQGDDVVAIPGTRRIDRVEENLGSLRVTLSPEDIARIAAAVPAGAASGTRYPAGAMGAVYRYRGLSHALRRPGDVVVHEGRDEEVGVVVALAHVQCEPESRPSDTPLQQPGAQAVIEEGIGRALIDQKFGESVAVRDQRGGVVAAPRGFVLAEILGEGGLRPAGGRGLDVRREGAARAEAISWFSAMVSAPWPPIE